MFMKIIDNKEPFKSALCGKKDPNKTWMRNLPESNRRDVSIPTNTEKNFLTCDLLHVELYNMEYFAIYYPE